MKVKKIFLFCAWVLFALGAKSQLSIQAPESGKELKTLPIVVNWKSSNPAAVSFTVKMFEKTSLAIDQIVLTQTPVFVQEGVKGSSISINHVPKNKVSYILQVTGWNAQGQRVAATTTSFSFNSITNGISFGANPTISCGRYNGGNVTYHVTENITNTNTTFPGKLGLYDPLNNVVIPGNFIRSPTGTISNQNLPTGTTVPPNATVALNFDITFPVLATVTTFDLCGYVAPNTTDELVNCPTFTVPRVTCPCKPCDSIKPRISSSLAEYGTNGIRLTNVLSANRLLQTVKAELVYFAYKGKPECLSCVKANAEYGVITSGSINNPLGTPAGQWDHVNNAPPPASSLNREIDFKARIGLGSLSNHTQRLYLGVPPVPRVSCCRDTLNFCMRYVFQDNNCNVCDTVLCYTIARDTMNVRNIGPIIGIEIPGRDSLIRGLPAGIRLNPYFVQASDLMAPDFDATAKKNYTKIVKPETDFPAYLLSEKALFGTLRQLKKEPLQYYRLGDPLNSPCGNGDFESGAINLGEWAGRMGTFSGNSLNNFPGEITSIGPLTGPSNIDGSPASSPPTAIPANHHLIVAQGMDPLVPTLPMTHNGSKYALRLGNSNRGNGMEIISKRFLVTQQNSQYSFWYATVLNDPSHTNGNPLFGVRIFEDGITTPTMPQTIDPSFDIDPFTGNANELIVSATNPFFKTVPNLSINGAPVRYSEWSCANLDLTPLIGKTISVEFYTKDCNATGHFGYAYIDDVCGACDARPQGNVSHLRMDTTHCGLPAKFCFDYSLPKLNGATGTLNVDLVFKNTAGVVVGTLNSGNLTGTLANNTYCFNLTQSNLPAGMASGSSFTVTAVGRFAIVGSTWTSSTNTIPYEKNCPCCKDYESVKITLAGSLATQAIAFPGPGSITYDVIRLTTTFTGLSLPQSQAVNKIVVALVDYRITPKYQDCHVCTSYSQQFGTLNVYGRTTVPPGIPTRPPGTIENQISNSRELTFNRPSVDELTIVLPPFSTIPCCEEEISYCLKYTFYDKNCKVCERIVCGKLTRKRP